MIELMISRCAGCGSKNVDRKIACRMGADGVLHLHATFIECNNCGSEGKWADMDKTPNPIAECIISWNNLQEIIREGNSLC